MRALGPIYRWFEFPHRLLATRRIMERPGARVLDVGCANRSPTITKRYFPRIVYTGLDRPTFRPRDEDQRSMDAFVAADLDRPRALAALGEATFDAILCSHVLEHVRDPLAVARGLSRCLAAGGLLYIETPAPRSLRFPRARDGWWGIRGCLNFEDDETHTAVVDMNRIRALLGEEGLLCGPVRPRRLWRRILLLPAYILAGVILRGYVPASVVWDVTGFASTVLAERRP